MCSGLELELEICFLQLNVTTSSSLLFALYGLNVVGILQCEPCLKFELSNPSEGRRTGKFRFRT
jgi:hypothetical protein